MIDPLVSISVLVVEDDSAVSTTLTNYLQRSGMSCATAPTAADAMRAVAASKPDVVLVDLGLPDAHGVGLIPWLAQNADCGIIVVTGAAAEADRVVGIELGADDYVVKPPALRELVARIRAVHRRRTQGGLSHEPPAQAAVASAAPASARASGWLRLGDCMICRDTATVQRMDGEPVHLTGAERKVLELLLAGGREPVSRSVLCEEALRRPLGAEDRAIDQIILALRRKLGSGGRDLIMSVRGAGYALAPQPLEPLPHVSVPAPADAAAFHAA